MVGVSAFISPRYWAFQHQSPLTTHKSDMAPLRVTPHHSRVSSSSKKVKDGAGVSGSARKKLFELDVFSVEYLFSCFKPNKEDQVDPEAADMEVKESDLATPLSEEPCVGVCIKCDYSFPIRDARNTVRYAREYRNPNLCLLCNKEEAQDREEILDYSDISSVEGSSRENTPLKLPSKESYEFPIQCVMCKKIYRSKWSDEDSTEYQCLDCNVKEVLRKRKPKSAFDLALSIVEKEVTNWMSNSVCPTPPTPSTPPTLSTPPTPPTYSHVYDGKCGAPVCKGETRYRVRCNACFRYFHTRCVALPDYKFQFFRCNECRQERNQENSLEEEENFWFD